MLPSRNSTCVTRPSGSVAVALMVMVGFQGYVVPSAGEVMPAVGGALPPTVIVDGALVADWSRSSVARAVYG